METGNIAIMLPEQNKSILKKIFLMIFPNWIQLPLLIFEILCVVGSILLFYYTQNKNEIQKL
jgi:hypothetical protein